MLTIIMGTAIGFVIASVVMSVAGFALAMNKRFVKWYTKKIMAATKEVAEEMLEEIEDLY